MRVWAALRFAETVRAAAAFRLLEAREALGGVEVEVLLADDTFQTEEVLHGGHRTGRVCDQPLATHEVQLAQREVSQPALEVLRVHTDPDGAPRRVHQPRRVVDERHAVEGGQVGSLRHRLRVVGNGACDGVAHHHDQLHTTRHVVDARRHCLRDEVTRRLLYRHLTVDRQRHLLPTTRHDG